MKNRTALFHFIIYLVIVHCIIDNSYSFGQAVYFERSFGGTGNDYARSVRQLTDGSIYVAGYSSAGANGGFDFTLNKLNRYGDLLWTKYYGDSLDNNGLYMNTCSDGNFIFVGETQTAVNGLDILLYKIDTSGLVLWSKKYGTAINESGKYVEQTSDGGYVVCGFKNDTSGSNDTYVLKLDPSGNFQWDKMIGGADNDYSDMVHEVENGKFIVTADTRSRGAGGYDVEVIKLSSTGTVIWDSTYGDSVNNGCQGILITSKKKYLSYGETEVYLFSPFDFYLELIDTDGTSLWRKTFGGTNSDALFSATEASDGGFVVTGYSNSYAPGPLNVIVIKTDSLGNLLWQQNYGDAGVDIGYEIIPSIYNGYLITGKMYGSDDDFYLLHLNTTGTITSAKDVNGIDTLNLVSCFPNPFQDKLFFQISGWDKIKNVHPVLKIFDTYGKKIMSAILDSDQTTILRGTLSGGIYFYLLEGDEGILSSGKISAE